MSRENVVSLSGGPVQVSGEPVRDVVEMLREVLAKAEAGEITDMAIATLHPNGDFGGGWSSQDGSSVRLAGAIAILGHRYTVAISES